MQPLFTLKGITKCFGDHTALTLESLVMKAGKIYSLTGPNGAGKSTLLHILAFLTKPCSGELFFNGEQVAGKSSTRKLRREVTLVHQSPYLFHGTVYSNVAFGLKARGIPSCRHRELVADVLALVGLKGFETRNSKELSGGEAQRVAIARALVVAPKVLLLDEPFSNLDNEASRLMEELIEALPCQGTTVIVSTHDAARQNRLNAENIHLVSGRIAA